MCLLVLAWKAHPRFRLILAANRDEYHDRPSLPLAKLDDHDTILAGRDLRADGTWLAVDRERCVGVITNYRDLQPPLPGAPSRGNLIPAYLTGTLCPAKFAAALEPDAARYSGFNLLLADQDSLWYVSNRAEHFACVLSPGVYGLSNQLLDTPWPKLGRVRRRFEELLHSARPSPTALLDMLGDRAPSIPEEASPSPGIPADLSRALSAPFVLHPEYGTRCSTIVLIEESNALHVIERSFNNEGEAVGDSTFDFGAGRW